MSKQGSYVFLSDWLDYVKQLPTDKDKLEFYNLISHYGCFGEKILVENQFVEGVFETFIKPRIDIMKNNYQEKINAGKTYGRKKTVNDNEIKMLAQEGMRAKEIASILGISEAAVYHSEGWKNRAKNL